MLLSLVFGSECSVVVELAYSLNMNIKQPQLYESLNANCCGSMTGVTCINNVIVAIEWVSMGLNGTLSNSTIPFSLDSLALS